MRPTSRPSTLIKQWVDDGILSKDSLAVDQDGMRAAFAGRQERHVLWRHLGGPLAAGERQGLQVGRLRRSRRWTARPASPAMAAAPITASASPPRSSPGKARRGRRLHRLPDPAGSRDALSRARTADRRLDQGRAAGRRRLCGRTAQGSLPVDDQVPRLDLAVGSRNGDRLGDRRRRRRHHDAGSRRRSRCRPSSTTSRHRASGRRSDGSADKRLPRPRSGAALRLSIGRSPETRPRFP